MGLRRCHGRPDEDVTWYGTEEGGKRVTFRGCVDLQAVFSGHMLPRATGCPAMALSDSRTPPCRSFSFSLRIRLFKFPVHNFRVSKDLLAATIEAYFHLNQLVFPNSPQ